MADWRGIAGQEILKQYFEKAADEKKISHAYILEGEPGTPKKEMAAAFARMMQCEKGCGCGVCHSCKAFDNGNHPDVIWVQHEKPDVIRINEIREQLINDISIKPYSSPYKIYLVDDAEKMNVAAQNALLKTLEEPPYYGIILFLTVNAGAFLPTIQSRSIILKLTNQENGTQLMEKEEQEKILSYLKRAHDCDRTEMALTAAKWKESGVSFRLILHLLRVWFRDVLVWKSTREEKFLTFPEEIREIKAAADRYSYAKIQEILMLTDQTERRISSNVNFELSIELLLSKMHISKEKEEDPWDDFAFPDFEEAKFYNDSYQEAMRDVY